MPFETGASPLCPFGTGVDKQKLFAVGDGKGRSER
jgi:hypothetical protein